MTAMPSGTTLLPHTVGTVAKLLQKGRGKERKEGFHEDLHLSWADCDSDTNPRYAAHIYGELNPHPHALLPDRAHISTQFLYFKFTS